MSSGQKAYAEDMWAEAKDHRERISQLGPTEVARRISELNEHVNYLENNL